MSEDEKPASHEAVNIKIIVVREDVWGQTLEVWLNVWSDESSDGSGMRVLGGGSDHIKYQMVLGPSLSNPRAKVILRLGGEG
mmetsp:Transcript_17390/g.34737  ORF Transcript_17390/g.34737 Transcript_17390/m.34737 type:complete len:82 (+) Transcript_17390:1687-1932(+)